MKHVAKGLLLMLSAPVLLGCVVTEEEHQKTRDELATVTDDLNNLKESLNNFQYLGLDPQLTVRLSEVEFKKPSTSYQSAEVSFKALVKATQTSFPINRYNARIRIEVRDPQGTVRDSLYIAAVMEDSIAALAEKQSLYRLDERNFSGFMLVPVDYSWYPDSDHEVLLLP